MKFQKLLQFGALEWLNPFFTSLPSELFLSPCSDHIGKFDFYIISMSTGCRLRILLVPLREKSELLFGSFPFFPRHG